MKFKIGFGFDVHRLGEGETLVLGGISIPSDKSAIGHSDADVLIHAICDALLGAANLRDIGFHFPDTDNSFKGIESKILLSRVMDKLRALGFSLGNIDATVCLQQPKISPFIDEMKDMLAETMAVDTEDISIKATTTERLGYVGREEGISAYAVALIYK